MQYGRRLLTLVGCGSGLLAAGPVLGQEGAGTASAIDPGATAWMLASCALVLFMTPGLALFYAGMARSKNVLGTMMHSIFCMVLITLQWVIVGYSIAFGDSAWELGLCGNLKHLFLDNMPWNEAHPAAPIPYPVHMAFQLMFAIITPALISGTFAERIKFPGFVLFTLLWATLVYDPLAHWVWGDGILSGSEEKSWLVALGLPGAMDFAGGTVVHISSGVSALVVCLLIGKRRGYPREPMPPHNLGLTVLGAGMLWFGWFGFNGGSGLNSDALAGLAFTVTHICAAAAAVSWAVVEWFHRGKVSVLGVATGLVAGLVCITPASGFVLPMSALIMGLVVSPVCYFFVAVLKTRLGYDDSLDVFGVHGVGGTVGALLTGLFSSSAIDADYVAGGKQFLAQLAAAGVTYLWAAVATAVIYVVVDRTIGMRVSADDEVTGLDVTQHGEVGYNL